MGRVSPAVRRAMRLRLIGPPDGSSFPAAGRLAERPARVRSHQLRTRKVPEADATAWFWMPTWPLPKDATPRTHRSDGPEISAGEQSDSDIGAALSVGAPQGRSLQYFSANFS